MRVRTLILMLALLVLPSLSVAQQAFLIAPSFGNAQPAPELVDPDTPIRFAWTSRYRLADVDFRLLVNGQIHHNFPDGALTVANVPLSQCPGEPAPTACFEYQGTSPGLANGEGYQVVLRVFNSLGSADSNVVMVTAGILPQVPPAGFRIIRVTTVAETTIDRATGAIVGTAANTRTEVIEK
jgi:hypothetical protein